MPETNRKIRTDTEWTQLFEAFNASGLTQKVFCKQQGVNYHSFRHRYQGSPLFRGQRRSAPPTAFKEVTLGADVPTSCGGWVVRLGDQVRIECPAHTPLEAVASLARGLAHDA